MNRLGLRKRSWPDESRKSVDVQPQIRLNSILLLVRHFFAGLKRPPIGHSNIKSPNSVIVRDIEAVSAPLNDAAWV
ncbi:MAG: hypothetical protein KDA51_14505 [Planctomycetales bacterium]|nr:hypothetical protein [Planctomycetales bacterium]MCA9182671.1 hypothetical protein [Planctomycetales bacterium]